MCVIPTAHTYSVLSRHLAAAELNKTAFAGLPIYGLLTDLDLFAFYSYDPSTRQFCYDEMILVNVTRNHAFSDVIDGLCISPFQSLRADLFVLQLSIRSSESFYRMVYVQI